MGQRQQYRSKPDHMVVAIQLNLDMKGFDYSKWGDIQHCKAGDWLVNNHGDIYTVDQHSFSNTYKQVSPGLYRKTGSIWAEPARDAGSIRTREGWTRYRRGDYLVCNNEDGSDCYSMDATTFHAQYEPVGED